MTTLDDAAERRIAQLVGDFYDGQRTMESAVDAAWREGAAAATEAAAKKCEEAGKKWAASEATSLNDQRKKNARRDEAFVLAAAIRGK